MDHWLEFGLKFVQGTLGLAVPAVVGRYELHRSFERMLGPACEVPTPTNPSVENRKHLVLLGSIGIVWCGAVTTLSHR